MDNITNITMWYVTLLLLLLSGCNSSNSGEPAAIDPIETTATLSCDPVGLGKDHPDEVAYQNILNEYIESGFPGLAAAIYTPERGLWVGAAGYADVENKTAMQPCSTLFSGSVAKLYTVTAAMTLQENQTMNLDDPVSWHVPTGVANNLPNAQLATIRQLMNHTAGIPDHDDDEALDNYVMSNNGHLPSAEEQLAYLYDDAPNFAPGTDISYSSANTLTLSLIIDSIAGEHHSNVISDAIIGKVGLTETYYKNEVGYPQPATLVNGYVGDSANLTDYTQAAVNYCEDSQGDAGIIASANDYLLFMKNLMEGNIVSQATLDLMQTGEEVFDIQGFKIEYGLGLFLISYDNELVKLGHSGATLGGMSHVYYYPPTQSYIVLLTNTLINDDVDLSEKWGAALLVGDNIKSIMSDFETLVLDVND